MYGLASALLALLALSAALAQPIRAVVSDCASMAGAFNSLQTRFETATKPTPLSMTLTLDCTADWSGCSSGAAFQPSNPAPSAAQPRVTITVKTNCKPGQIIQIPPVLSEEFIHVDTRVSSATCVVSVSGPIQLSNYGIRHVAAGGTKSTLKVKDVSFYNFQQGVLAGFLESVSVTGGTFLNSAAHIYAAGITKSVTITQATFDSYSIAAIYMSLPSNTRVIATGNKFMNAYNRDDNAILVRQEPGKMNINLGKTTLQNSGLVPICITSYGPVVKPVISVAGSVGITPIKADKSLMPGGWPVSQDCNVAEFSRS